LPPVHGVADIFRKRRKLERPRRKPNEKPRKQKKPPKPKLLLLSLVPLLARPRSLPRSRTMPG